jgi:hypothetical protein
MRWQLPRFAKEIAAFDAEAGFDGWVSMGFNRR